MTTSSKEKEAYDKGHSEGYNEGFNDGIQEGNNPGNDTEIGDITDTILKFAEEIQAKEDDPSMVRLVSYKEVNDIKRNLIERIDAMIEQ